MSARPLALAAASLCTLAAFADGSPTRHYRVQTRTEAVVDLTALGGPPQNQDSKTTAFYAVALADSAGGRSLHVSLDSITVDPESTTTPVPAAILDSARGASATGFVAAGGTVSNLKVASENPLAMQLLPVFQNFYPRMKPTARVDKWTDTVEYDTPQGKLGSLHTKTIANWVVTGEELHDGVSARKVQSAYSLARNGTITGGQGQVTIGGTATGAATYWVSADGGMIGADLTEEASMTLTMAQAPAPIPVKSKNHITIAVLK